MCCTCFENELWNSNDASIKGRSDDADDDREDDSDGDDDKAAHDDIDDDDGDDDDDDDDCDATMAMATRIGNNDQAGRNDGNSDVERADAGGMPDAGILKKDDCYNTGDSCDYHAGGEDV